MAGVAGVDVLISLGIVELLHAGGDTARPKVCEPKHQRAAQGEHDEAGLNEIEEWQDEQVEADVAEVDGIGGPEILGPNQAQESIPFAGEHKTENCGRCSRPKNEKWGKPARVRLSRP